MASFCLPAYVFLIVTMVVLLQPWCASGDIISPIFGNLVCKMMECGKGTCIVSKNGTLGFECQCDNGWKQVDIPQFPEKLTFLPCLVPNCTMNSSCIKDEFTFSPPTSKPTTSTFNPCHWTDCGGGTCNRTSLFQYRCECEEGYNNMFKIPLFPCYKQCAFQDNCSPLGINMSQVFLSPPSSSATNTLNHGGIKLMAFKALGVLGMLVVML